MEEIKEGEKHGCAKRIFYSEAAYIFGKLLEKVLTFFEDGTMPFDTAQTVEVMRLRDALIRAEAANGDWVAVE